MLVKNWMSKNVITVDINEALIDAVKLLKHNDIDFMVVGDQYRNKEVIGHENSKYGVLYYTVDDRSTTNIIDKIKQL